MQCSQHEVLRHDEIGSSKCCYLHQSPYRDLCELFAHLPHARTADDYETLLPWNLQLPD
jgi:hypothetical protein